MSLNRTPHQSQSDSSVGVQSDSVDLGNQMSSLKYLSRSHVLKEYILYTCLFFLFSQINMLKMHRQDLPCDLIQHQPVFHLLIGWNLTRRLSEYP